MLSADEKLAKYMDRLGQQSPDGRRFVTVPWLEVSAFDRMKLPFYLKLDVQIGEVLLIFGWLMIFIGLFSPLGVGIPFGIALLITMHISNRQAWKSTAFWGISKVEYPTEVTEKESVTISVVIKNHSPKVAVYNLIVSLRFTGAQQEFQSQLIESIQPNGTASLKFTYIADRGMGAWHIGEINITTRDTLGIKFFSLAHPIEANVRVNPEHIPLTQFIVERAGLSLHSGDYEVKSAGSSTSFLGLREWRIGDSMTHIDWKRSVRTGELLVKEFEKLCATDATIIIDTTEYGHGEFGDISTMEALKDSAISAFRCLVSQQIQVQMISADMHIPFGKSQSHIEYLTNYIRDIKPTSNLSFSKLVLDHLHLVPTDSVIIMIFCSANTDFKNLIQSFIALNDRRVEINLVVIDTESFFKLIKKKANLDEMQSHSLEYVIKHVDDKTQNAEVRSMLRKILEKIYYITPGKTFADVYNLNHGK
jgi:uncharacterized protein (DUF58 family)